MNHSFTFQVEDVTPAVAPLETQPFEEISQQYSPKVYHASHKEEQLIDFGSHAFLNALHKAYAQHRPFVLSPDMIWILIAQGFAHHVNNNADELKHFFVDHEERKTITSYTYAERPEEAPWEELIPELCQNVDQQLKTDLGSVFAIDFSTTTRDSRLVSQLSLLNSMQSYFRYVVIGAICGIPEITLEGTVADWKKVKAKTLSLSQYHLQWWVDELIPILDECIATANQKVDTTFWMHIFKIHTPDDYGSQETIDGWILKFFPYDKYGDRALYSSIAVDDIDVFPRQILNTPLKFINKATQKHFPVAMLSGFIGARQKTEKMAIRPEIGWIITEDAFQKNNFDPNLSGGKWMIQKIDDFPEFLLGHKRLFGIKLEFNGKVNIPEAFFDTQLRELEIQGEVSEKLADRMISRLRETEVYINGYLLPTNLVLDSKLLSSPSEKDHALYFVFPFTMQEKTILQVLNHFNTHDLPPVYHLENLESGLIQIDKSNSSLEQLQLMCADPDLMQDMPEHCCIYFFHDGQLIQWPLKPTTQGGVASSEKGTFRCTSINTLERIQEKPIDFVPIKWHIFEMYSKFIPAPKK